MGDGSRSNHQSSVDNEPFGKASIIETAEGTIGMEPPTADAAADGRDHDSGQIPTPERLEWRPTGHQSWEASSRVDPGVMYMISPCDHSMRMLRQCRDASGTGISTKRVPCNSVRSAQEHAQAWERDLAGEPRGDYVDPAIAADLAEIRKLLTALLELAVIEAAQRVARDHGNLSCYVALGLHDRNDLTMQISAKAAAFRVAREDRWSKRHPYGSRDKSAPIYEDEPLAIVGQGDYTHPLDFDFSVPVDPLARMRARCSSFLRFVFCGRLEGCTGCRHAKKA